MPGDRREFFMLGDELVNALPLIGLAIEVDDVKMLSSGKLRCCGNAAA